jgi:hypothetical protein
MAAEDKKISVLTEWLYEDIVDIASIVAAYAGGNYRIAMQTIRQYVLGDREINGTGSNDIPTNGGTQTFINKRLDSPSFNDSVQLNSAVTATQMNFLQNLDVNVKQKFDTIDDDVRGVENTVEDLSTTINTLQADKIYSVGMTAGSTSITVLAQSMDSDKINPYSLSISVYEQISGSLMTLLNLSNVNISISDNALLSIAIGDVVSGKAYQIVIRYRLAEQ